MYRFEQVGFALCISPGEDVYSLTKLYFLAEVVTKMMEAYALQEQSLSLAIQKPHGHNNVYE